MCQLFGIMCYITEIRFCVTNMVFDKSAFEIWAAAFKISGPFPNYVFAVVVGETLVPKVVYRPWDITGFG